ncbi:MAG: ribokinase [Planctomycetia bacterium]|nr:ribokinase [Planctomycetia bacterium]
MKKIINVGSFIIDFACYANSLPIAGETTLGLRSKLGAGGKGSNQATASHRSGGDVRMIGKIGTDSLAKIITDHYEQEGMSQEYIKISQTNDTGVALIEIDTKSGQNRIIVVKGANADLTIEDVQSAEKDFQDCEIVMTQLETSAESILECKKLAQKYHRTFLMNPAPFQDIPQGLFDGIDYLTPNETETEFFTGIPVNDQSSARKASEKLLSMGVKKVVLTLGEHGVYYFDGSMELLVPPPKVTAVDTTGAGDALNGGLAVALAEQMPIEVALKFANCVGALSVTKAGSSPAMPFRSETEKLLYDFYQVKL